MFLQYNKLLAIIIQWKQQTRDGFFISCPRDLNTQKFLCEICLIGLQGELYCLDSDIHRIINFDELYYNFYKYYFYLNCLVNLSKMVMNYYIKTHRKSIPILSNYSKLFLNSNNIYLIKEII
jgi:hypothetical protein